MQLLPASFRGAPFAVLADEVAGGRRIALHQYPGRDEPWAEDMGRDARRFRFRGFIVDGDVVFAGGPIALQRVLLLAALEKRGPGVLTHPTLGVLNVSVTRFSLGEDLGGGRMSTIDIELVESGARASPSLLTRGSGLLTASNLCKAALAVDGIRAIALAVDGGGRRRDLSTSGASWSSRAIALGTDATALHRLAAQLPGNFGRYAVGEGAATTLPGLVATASKARVAIVDAAMVLGTAVAGANLGQADDIAGAAVALVVALAAACADPADALRLLGLLIDFQPSRPEAVTPIGSAFGRMVARAAVAELAVAAARYQPTSSDEASVVITRVGRQLDRAATVAADAGEDASFSAIRTARAAIVQDLRGRGATLARLRTFRSTQGAPALALAQRFYGDAGRADELVRRAAPVHPLFMPAALQALAA